MPDDRIWTIGHSTRAIGEFVELLRSNDIAVIADVRRFPRSRWHPQFNEGALRDALAAEGIDYQWFPALGGRRQPLPDSVNDAWRNESFRGYADHIASEEFAEGLFELLVIAEGLPTAIMCSEAVWWRCHRSLIADVLRFVGFDVRHIMEGGKTVEHTYTSPAHIERGMLTYSAVGTGDMD
jgi:uncharacterized protein (DUF488 family)